MGRYNIKNFISVKAPCQKVVDFPSSISVVISNGGEMSFSKTNLCVDKFKGEVMFNRQLRNLILCNNEFSYKHLNLINCGDYVSPLLLCLKSLSSCKFSLKEVKRFEHLFLWTQKSFWVDKFRLMNSLLHFGMNNKNQVFKLEIYFFFTFCGKINHHRLCANNFYCFDTWLLNKEMRYDKFDFNLNAFLNPFLWLYLKFVFHFDKVNSATKLRLDYFPEERRFVLNEKGTTDSSLPTLKGKQEMTLENSKTSLSFSHVDEHFVDALIFERYYFPDGIGCLSLTCNEMRVLNAQDESPYKLINLTDHVEKVWKCIVEFDCVQRYLIDYHMNRLSSLGCNNGISRLFEKLKFASCDQMEPRVHN